MKEITNFYFKGEYNITG